MASDKTPDDATGDGVNSAELLARVHTFLASLLAFLGFRAMPTGTVSSMLETLAAWLKDASAIRRDPQGATAKIWWDAFKVAWGGGQFTGDAEAAANSATAAFGRYFLPIADEDDRDTLNTADFDAMRDELDQADRYRQEICDALDGRAGPDWTFLHPRIIDELRAERDALLKTNAHHASEIEGLREANRDLDNTSTELVKRIDELESERNALHEQLDAEKRLVAQQRSELATLRGYCDEIEREQQACRVELAAAGIPDTGHTVRFDIEQLRAKLAGAIVPQPKPERVEPGQRWAVVLYVQNHATHNSHVHLDDGHTWAQNSMIAGPRWHYLGTEAR